MHHILQRSAPLILAQTEFIVIFFEELSVTLSARTVSASIAPRGEVVRATLPLTVNPDFF